MKKRGSGRLELTGWLLFPLGIPYTLWRMTHKMMICSQCDSEELADRNSAIARKIAPALEDIYPEPVQQKPQTMDDAAAEFFPQRNKSAANTHKITSKPDEW